MIKYLNIPCPFVLFYKICGLILRLSRAKQFFEKLLFQIKEIDIVFRTNTNITSIQIILHLE